MVSDNRVSAGAGNGHRIAIALALVGRDVATTDSWCVSVSVSERWQWRLSVGVIAVAAVTRQPIAVSEHAGHP